MVSKKVVISSAEETIKRTEKEMPVEAKFCTNIRNFFEKKPRRLIVSGITALVFLLLVYILSYYYHERSFFSNFVIIVAGCIEITAFGVFVANIRKFSLVKFGISAGIWSVLLYIGFCIVTNLSSYDPAQLDRLPGIIRQNIIRGIFVCLILTAAAVFIAYLTVRKKPNTQF